jgi:hypothetical protein
MTKIHSFIRAVIIFLLVSIATGLPPLTSRTLASPSYSALTVKFSGKCVDVQGGDIADGTAIVQWDCHGGDNQLWSFQSVAGYYEVVSKVSGKCLDVQEASQANDTIVLQWSCYGGDNQLWSVQRVGDYYRFVAKHSGKCLDVRGADPSNGVALIQWDCANTDNQLFSYPLNHTIFLPFVRKDHAPIPEAPYAWKVLVLVYRNLDGTYTDKDGQLQHVTASMDDQDYQYARDTIDRFPLTVWDWSSGHAVMKVTTLTVNRTITSLNSPDGGINEDIARPEIDAYNPNNNFDSILTVFSYKSDIVWGLASVGLSSRANGAGFAMIHLPVRYSNWQSVYPEEILVHEWLHNVEGFYRGLGYQVPGLHDGQQYGYQPDPTQGNSWHRWYEDYMQNKVWDGTKYIGVPPEAWLISPTYHPAQTATKFVPYTIRVFDYLARK